MDRNKSLSLPVTLSLNTSRILLLGAVALLLGVLGVLVIYLGIPDKSLGIMATGACFCLLAALTLLSLRGNLTLTDEGFVHRGAFKSLSVRWAEVEDFVQGDFRTIGWNYIAENGTLTTMRKLNRGAGTEAAISGQFGGMSLQELMMLMNRLHISRQTVPQLEPRQRFALALSAILTEMNGHRHDCLHGDKPGQSLKMQMREVLSSYWDVKNRQQLDSTLQWLSQEGHRAEYEAMHDAIGGAGPISDPLNLLEPKVVEAMSAAEKEDFLRQIACVTANCQHHTSLFAWDLCRLVSVARFGAGAEYLTEQEAWQWILDAAKKLQSTFGSWHDLSENYLVGRDFSGIADSEETVEAIRKSLLDSNNAASVWNQVPWCDAEQC